MVKPLHPLETIAARILRGDDRRVRLSRDAVDEATEDPAAAAIRALAEPLEYPPFAESTVPGDRVAIAVDSGVPCVVEIVRGVVDALAHAGVDPDACSLVTASEEMAQLCRTELGSDGESGVRVVVHDPDDEKDLCFVGINRKREPLVVNRTIFEADLVLPIGRAHPNGGAFNTLFPQFSSAAVIQQYRTPANRSSREMRQAHRREILEAGRLIGAAMVMQVVPGPGDSVVAVVAGQPKSVASAAKRLYRQWWLRRSPQRASLVVATVGGGALAQTWENVGQAVAAAARLVDDDGAIAICTNLDRPLGESLGRLVGQKSVTTTAKKVFHEQAEDSWAAWQIAQALARGPVYLMSQLDADGVEEMGMAPVQEIDELVRLAERRESTIVLEDAQNALAVVGGDVDED